MCYLCAWHKVLPMCPVNTTAQGGLVVPPGNVDLADVVQRGPFARFVPGLAADFEALFKVAQGRLVVPPEIIDRADVVQRGSAVDWFFGKRKRLLERLQGLLRRT